VKSLHDISRVTDIGETGELLYYWSHSVHPGIAFLMLKCLQCNKWWLTPNPGVPDLFATEICSGVFRSSNETIPDITVLEAE
jgi:hypothetical protein